LEEKWEGISMADGRDLFRKEEKNTPLGVKEEEDSLFDRGNQLLERKKSKTRSI